MTEIVDGKLIFSEMTKNSNGGTEQMARRIVRDIPQELLKGKQIIFSRINELRPDLEKFFYAHDLADDPEAMRLRDPDLRNQFSRFIFVSNWQLQQYNQKLGIPYGKSSVISNGIEVEPYTDKSFDGPVRLIYHTTPHRGLEILAPVFKELSNHCDVHLDVFSSFEAYGWPQRDEPYKPLFDSLNLMDNVTVHGYQPNDVIRKALKKSHIFAYPSIWTETSCIALIEAMCYGNYAVHSNLGALPETCNKLTLQYMWDEDINRHAQRFYFYLRTAVENIKDHKMVMNARMKEIADIACRSYNWEYIQADWHGLLNPDSPLI